MSLKEGLDLMVSQSVILLALKSIYFFTIKDSKPHQHMNVSFNHISEMKITLPCSVMRLKEDVQADKSQSLVLLLWCDTEIQDFCPYDFKWVALLYLK